MCGYQLTTCRPMWLMLNNDFRTVEMKCDNLTRLPNLKPVCTYKFLPLRFLSNN